MNISECLLCARDPLNSISGQGEASGLGFRHTPALYPQVMPVSVMWATWCLPPIRGIGGIQEVGEGGVESKTGKYSGNSVLEVLL